MEQTPKSDQNPKVSKMLKLLLESAMANADKKRGGERYSDTLKELAHLIFSVGGLAVYEILSHNLPLPSIATIRRKIYETDVIIEGDFRFKQLKKYSQERNLPFKYILSEDATRVTGKIQYHAASNQIVGFTLPLDANGVPVVSSFPATSAERISEYFNSTDTSDYAYCIMAQPLKHKTPPFCLAMYGTNNKFTSLHVLSRWQWVAEKAKEEGIEVVGFASDGDPRLLKAMTYRVFTRSSPPAWKWFKASKTADQLFTQDFIHIGTKFKSRLLKPSLIMPFGNEFVVSRGHILELIRTVSKDQHELCESFINPKDKMNYKAVQKISNKNVSDLLRRFVPNSEGTAVYLDMMREVVEAFDSTELTPLERVGMIWEWVFFLRIWRSWLQKQDGYSIRNNFITANTYTCVEINAHVMIQALIKFRDEEHHFFLPSLMSSQPCETTFRRLRSSTTTHCGVVSFSILDMKNYFRNIDLLAVSEMKLETDIHFPRQKKAMNVATNNVHIPVSLPEDYEIETAVLASLERAKARALRFKLLKNPSKTFIPECHVRIIPPSEVDNSEEDMDSDDDNSAVHSAANEEAGEQDSGSESENEFPNQQVEDVNDVIEDLFIVSSGCIGLKTFDNVTVTESSPFVLVSDFYGKRAVIKKSSLCWLLSSGDTKLSSDRLQRVKADHVNHSTSLQKCLSGGLSHPHREDMISVGDWCAFRSEDSSVVVGRVLAFSYLSGSSRKDQEYGSTSAPTSPPAQNARGLGCLCSWFKIIPKSQSLVNIDMDVHGYYDLKYYICSVPRPKLNEAHLELSCSVRDILRASK